MSTTECSIFGK